MLLPRHPKVGGPVLIASVRFRAALEPVSLSCPPLGTSMGSAPDGPRAGLQQASFLRISSMFLKACSNIIPYSIYIEINDLTQSVSPYRDFISLWHSQTTLL